MTNEVTIQTSLRAPAQRKAKQAIENVHLAYYEKDGIRDTAIKLEGQLESASRHVFALAQYAAQSNPSSLEAAAVFFVELCEYAEQVYKAEHEVENLRDALPTWATYKSNILRGVRAGLNPLEHKTEKIFRSKTMEKLSRSRALAAPEGEEARAGPPQTLSEPQLEEIMATTAVPETLRQLTAQIVYAVEVVNIRKVDQAEEILREAWQKLGALTDRRKLKLP